MKPKTHLLKGKAVFIDITPFGFYHYGKEFFDAALGIKQSTKYSPVPYYLYCHSIELFLKSFLLVKGVTKKELKDTKNYGHNLEKILKKTIELGLNEFVQIKPEQEEEILKANEYYNVPRKGFEYFEVVRGIKEYPELPDLSLLKRVAYELSNNLKAVSFRRRLNS